MTLQQLAYKEDKLYSKVIELYHQPQSKNTEIELNSIFIEYKKVHLAYAEVSSFEIEALKRGLFLQWYALTEPNYLTGISELDEDAEHRIIQRLNELIDSEMVDDELIWMLNYYLEWDWVFERYQFFKKTFIAKIGTAHSRQFPATIEREKMRLRGQMGEYWNSLTKFGSQ